MSRCKLLHSSLHILVFSCRADIKREDCCTFLWLCSCVFTHSTTQTNIVGKLQKGFKLMKSRRLS